MKILLCFLLYLVSFVLAAPTVTYFLESINIDKDFKTSEGLVTFFSVDSYQCTSLCRENNCNNSSKTTTCYAPNISYEFKVNGKLIKSENIYSFDRNKDHTADEISYIKSIFSNNNHVKVYYNNKNSKSFLIKNTNIIGAVISIAFSFVSFLIPTLYFFRLMKSKSLFNKDGAV